jgi:hypothetical protein
LINDPYVADGESVEGFRRPIELLTRLVGTKALGMGGRPISPAGAEKALDRHAEADKLLARLS